MDKKKRTLKIAQFGILLAIEAIFCFTPLGSLPAVGPIVATLSHVPVVITALLLGVGAGTAMGAFWGLFSFLVWTFMTPSPLVAFLFTPFYTLGEFNGNFGSLIICFAPRILAGTVAGLLGRGNKKNITACAVGGAAGSFVNTAGVLLGAVVFFGAQYESVAGGALLTVVGSSLFFSGVPEAVVAAIAAGAVVPAVVKALKL